MQNNIAPKRIPKGWSVKKIKDLLDFEQPGDYIVKSTAYTSNSKTPVLTANKSFILGYTDEDFGIYSDIPAIIFDDFTTDSKYVDFPFKIKSSAIKILTCKDKNSDLKYVYEIMKSINFQIANHKRHYISQYQELDIILPLLPEQKKIAEILSTVDEEIQKINSLISQTKKLKSGLINDLFQRGIGHKKFKKTILGKMPEEWEVKTLNDFVSHVGSGSTPRGGSLIYLTEGIPFIRSQNVYFDGLRVDDLVYVSKSVHSTMNRSVVRSCDLLLNITGASIGRACIVPENFPEANVNQHVCIIRPTEKLNNTFLFYFLQSNFGQDQIFSLQVGGNREGLNFQNIRSFKIMVPSVSEQKKIVEILYAFDKKLKISCALKNKLLVLKKGLVADLLSGKVRTI